MNSSKVDFGLIRENSKEILLNALKGIHGTKTIVWERHLAGLFGLIANVSLLRENDVLNMYYISNLKLDLSHTSSVIFLTTPNTASVNNINRQIRLEANTKMNYYLWCVPRITTLCIDHLKLQGIHDVFISITELPIFMYRFDNDIASLELPNCFKDLHLYQDPTSLYYIARALMNIQGLYGIIPNVYGKGSAAQQVYNLMVQMRRELAGNEPQISSQIDQVILIDRSVDLISPLATQLTYEGLIDQYYGIKHCIAKLPMEKFASTETPMQQLDSLVNQKEKSIQLTSNEQLFAELRDCNFSCVGSKLSALAKKIEAELEQRHDAKTIKKIKQFVEKLPQVQTARNSLETHTAIAELIKEKISHPSFRPCLETEQELLRGYETDRIKSVIEDCILHKDPINKVLQLICLQNSVNCGLKKKVLESYKQDIINTYGFEHFTTLLSLEKAGLLSTEYSKSTYNVILKTLKLTVEDVNEANPTDVSYVHSGYAPLSVRLCEYLQEPGWRAINEVLSVLPGETVVETQQLPISLRQRRNSGSSVSSSQTGAGTSLVVFIGGCTYSEVAGLRFLSSKVDQGGPEYFILTTNLVNPESFISSLSED